MSDLLNEQLLKQREATAGRWLQIIHQWCKDVWEFRTAYASTDPSGLTPYLKGYHCLLSLAYGSAMCFPTECGFKVHMTREELAVIESAKTILNRKMEETLLETSNDSSVFAQFRNKVINSHEITGP